jgi:hypothetical protein
MAIFKDTIIVDRPFDRVAEVTVIHPEDMNVTNVQELAENAWPKGVAQFSQRTRLSNCPSRQIVSVRRR